MDSLPVMRGKLLHLFACPVMPNNFIHGKYITQYNRMSILKITHYNKHGQRYVFWGHIKADEIRGLDGSARSVRAIAPLHLTVTETKDMAKRRKITIRHKFVWAARYSRSASNRLFALAVLLRKPMFPVRWLTAAMHNGQNQNVAFFDCIKNSVREAPGQATSDIFINNAI